MLEAVSWTILFKELELLGVEGALALGADQLHGLLVRHAQLHEGQSNHDRCTAQARYAVDGHAGTG